MADSGIATDAAGRLINLVPVGLREAAIDSPSARATVAHYGEQIDLLERWLEDYCKATTRVAAESLTLESMLTAFTSHAIVPVAVAESMLDHDYDVVAMKKYAEAAKDFWMSMVTVVKRLTGLVVEPIRVFLANDVRAFKDARKAVEVSQKTFDTLHSRYAGLSKAKEPSSLREEAFQLHEARKQYLRALMDLTTLAPQFRFALDKLLVRIFYDQWKEMRASRDSTATTFQRGAADMDRTGAGAVAEKQGHLYLRTYSGRPTRAVWLRRWAFLRNGVFGWLLQGPRAADVVESERIGVLLCNVRPAPAEERRFCFELKTNKHTIILQAESQAEMMDWITAVQTAKSKALEDPGAIDSLAVAGRPHSDPAFAISQPPVPEFGTLILGSTDAGASNADDLASSNTDRSNTLPLPDQIRDTASVDLARRSTLAIDDQGHTSRLLNKLTSKSSSTSSTANAALSPATGGIASLIAASHGSMPVGPSLPVAALNQDVDRPRTGFILALRDMPSSTLAPSTLANTPIPTNLSKSAVVVTGDRGLSAALDKTGLPNSLVANTWGCGNSAFVSRLDRPNEQVVVPDARSDSQPSPRLLASASPRRPPLATRPERSGTTASAADLSSPNTLERSRSASPTKRARNLTVSTDTETPQTPTLSAVQDFPNYYPLQLKTQDAQFRLLFPTVKRDERVVMVFRAMWNPNDLQDLPGRIYVTAHSMYFYSNHLGLVLASTRRINFLVRNSTAADPLPLEDLVGTLVRMESEAPEHSPSLESWEDVAPDTPSDPTGQRSRRGYSNTSPLEYRAPVRVEHGLKSAAAAAAAASSAHASKFKLPAHSVQYTPPGNLLVAVEREFDVSPKALFHVMFGDKAALWQLLQYKKGGRNLNQGPWMSLGEARLRRDFEFTVATANLAGMARSDEVRDYQTVDVLSDHLCYVVTDKRTPWYLPMRHSHRLVSKIVITHVAKRKCKLAIFVRVEWLRTPLLAMFCGMVERQGLHELQLDALDLADVVADQVRRLGAHSMTKKAIQLFGPVGQSTEIAHLQLDDDDESVSLEVGRAAVPRSLASLLSHEAGSAAGSALAVVLAALLRLGQYLARTLTANKVILAALAMSVLYNTYHTSRDGLQWYREASAPRPEASACYGVFADEYSLDNADVVSGDEGEDDDVVGAWYEEYCRSCQSEAARLA
ncbi:hypothetical protein DV737_g879, partial [Chaetothyriales sp. CBS 132003]